MHAATVLAFVLVGWTVCKTEASSLFGKISCDICTDVVEDTEAWIGKGEARNEQKILARCDKFFEFFKAKKLAKEFCDNLLKRGLDAIIAGMEDPQQEKKDAAAICGHLHMCN
ncbi:hypothetical protein L596_012695 [Steinernema carpocapsae]|uniref:Saposin B-type domain-containing protein n=1 Tax=Steinernema carpocapsae TaxID=34508 RepID=A0A4U5NYH4_STECR|nr:hypothetical protein L596_012695 [Steinernema carpocapsae]